MSAIKGIHKYLTVTSNDVEIRVPEEIKEAWKLMFGRRIRAMGIRGAFNRKEKTWKFGRDWFLPVNEACHFAFPEEETYTRQPITVEDKSTQTGEERENTYAIPILQRRKVLRAR